MNQFKPTKYKVEALCCGKIISDQGQPLSCPDCSDPHFLRTVYDQKQLEVKDESLGLYRFSDWLPVKKTLEGSGAPVTFKSVKLAEKLGLSNLWITFNGWWPEKGARMKTGTFKECEAYSVCARIPDKKDGILVVASAGNTARAFARVCSQNNIPLVITIPEDNLEAMWSDKPLADCVKIIAAESGSDYFDAIDLSGKICQGKEFFPEGGAKNIARRDGMGTTVLSAVTAIGEIPDYYFQAVGSGTGAIAAWEANLRFLDDGRFGSKKMKLMVSQNVPFKIIYDSWKADSRALVTLDDDEARQQVIAMNAKVLSNRKPPYSLPNGLYDALRDTGGDVLLADNEEAAEAGRLFRETEGNDISPAASVALASLIKAVKNGTVKADETVMLNITGGGMGRFASEHKVTTVKADLVFSPGVDAQELIEAVRELYK